jgi:hypothetical protein
MGRLEKLGDALRQTSPPKSATWNAFPVALNRQRFPYPPTTLIKLFQFAEQSRKDLNHLLATLPAGSWTGRRNSS